MGGFKNESINALFAAGSLKRIIAHLIQCSSQMKANCRSTENMLKNDEDKITNHLIECYLNNGVSEFRYVLQAPENFDPQTDQYIGRSDIKVISSDWFSNSKCYFLIECKRIDGTQHLNKEYIINGVSRFVSTPPKYSSYHKKNIMFAYVVKAINISDAATKISQLQKTLLTDVVATPFSLAQCDTEYGEYYSEYTSDSIGVIELRHLFYDFAEVIS
ncbi:MULTISPECIES: hypothetical protein [Caproicibacterium]|jgi:hypothetical protein|uniref:Uncharacterized protein n=1 Tax=Caproicibacterium argilliputei TaxID=3030016 RepID=A0AA97H0Y7_9FIRM|nr:hypothetical protein [Caproicibacterium argilliputei]WOC32071.1 hypothetical protein PXC00_12875 [Caproicibacterium argilliputei]HBC31934.1 hypothetical protein [Clostridiales bacterium]HCS75129.1 hypothetical protein [Clostridiales bacterium]